MFLKKTFYNSYFRLPEKLKEDLLRFEIKDFIKFDEKYYGYYVLKAFLLKYKYGKEVLNKGAIKFPCGHENDDIQFMLYFATMYEGNDELFNKKCFTCFDKKAGISALEKNFIKNIKDLYKGNGKIIENDRKELNGKEIDVLIIENDRKIGFEFNGIYWHQGEKGLNKHLNKLEKSKINGVNLIFIDEYSYQYRRGETIEEIDFILNGKSTIKTNKRKLDYVENEGVIEIKNFVYSEYIIDELKEIIKNNKGKKILVKHEKELGNGKIYEDLGFKNIGEEGEYLMNLDKFTFEYYKMGYDIYEYDHK